MRTMKSRSKLLGALALSTALLVTPALSQAQLPAAMTNQGLPSLAPMLEKVTPAVVSINVAGSKTVQTRPNFQDYLFGRRAPRQQEQPFQGLGSGVIIDADDGYIVTNYHVIDEADEIVITLKDGREFAAKKVGGDKQSDIALLQIKAKNLVAVKLADSDKTKVGDFTVAIGNPFGLTQTVTSGIVSALGRAGLNIEGYEDFIQTDAAVNSGNSGGALVNLRGELIGINTAIIAPNGGNVGIAFAIPSNMMKSLVNQILDFGEVRRGVLGIRGNAVNSDLAESMNLPVSQGAFVSSVIEDTAAEKAGLNPGDVIISVNGTKIKSFNELRSKIGTLGAGAEVDLGVIRDGDEITVKVILQGADSPSNVKSETLMPQLAGANLSNGESRSGLKGIVVDEVQERSPAALLGLENGDVIVGANRIKVDTVKDLKNVLDNTNGTVVLNIQRGKTSLYLILR